MAKHRVKVERHQIEDIAHYHKRRIELVTGLTFAKFDTIELYDEYRTLLLAVVTSEIHPGAGRRPRKVTLDIEWIRNREETPV